MYLSCGRSYISIPHNTVSRWEFQKANPPTSRKRNSHVFVRRFLSCGLCLQNQNLTGFESLFCLDIAREASRNCFQDLTEQKIESYILQPQNWTELIKGLEEVQTIKNKQVKSTKNTLVLNNWFSLRYLLHNAKSLNATASELLLKLKFLSDQLNIIIISNDLNNNSLNDWSQVVLVLESNNILSVEKSTIDKWNSGDNIQIENNFNICPFPKVNEDLSLESTKSLNIVSSRQENSTLYESLLSKLADASNRGDLLIVRKEIQSSSTLLSSTEKTSLSNIYKVHLQRIKLFEDNLLGSPLNIDAS